MVRNRRILSFMTALPLMFSSASWTVAANFGTGLTDTEWRIDATPFYCQFYQPIPQYGLAVFFHQAGEALEFYLESSRNLMAEGQAALVIEAPEWRSSALTTDLGYVSVRDRKIPVRVETARAGRMMDELGQGMAPTFTRRAKFGDEAVRVRISPVNFRQYYNDYLACQAGLLAVNFSQIERSTIRFPTGGSVLSSAAKSQMDDIIHYLKTDDLVVAIFIDGHSDSVGNRFDNRRLSEARAFRVSDYLVSQGIDPTMILTRYHGDRYPIASNETAEGRAQNRRVTIALERVDNDPNDPLRRLPDFNAR